MTFTEAAVEVLRLAGKPLHYKKITEIAIEKNLLSHVGKTPEVTMSSRLATMVKKDRGEAPIIKVKPGVFGLREFDGDVIKAAASQSGHDYELPEGAEVEEEVAEEEAPVEATDPEVAVEAVEATGGHRLPGEDVFPEEEDDDEPILANLEDEEKRSGKRRRRRRRGGRPEGDEPRTEARPSAPREPREPREPRRNGRDDRPLQSRDRDHRDRDRGRDRGRDRDRERHDARPPERRHPRGDWNREPDEGQSVGRDLADAIAHVMGDGGTRPLDFVRVAELLVRRGRLDGDPGALAPTVAAAVRGDIARLEAKNARSRFRVVDGRLALSDWSLPRDAVRMEQEASRSLDRQRSEVRRAFLRALDELPTASFAELIATWLNTEGIGSLRAVRRPHGRPGELHLAGVLRRGLNETGIAIVVVRDGSEVGRERIVEMRGSMHHYGTASVAWLITTGTALSGAREEANVLGVAPCTIFDGIGLARAMEEAGVGLRRTFLPVLSFDAELVEMLRGPEEARRERERYRDRDDRGRRDEEGGEGDDREPREPRGDDREPRGDDREPRGDERPAREGEAAAGEEGQREGRRRRRRRRGRGDGPRDAQRPAEGGAEPTWADDDASRLDAERDAELEAPRGEGESERGGEPLADDDVNEPVELDDADLGDDAEEAPADRWATAADDDDDDELDENDLEEDHSFERLSSGTSSLRSGERAIPDLEAEVVDDDEDAEVTGERDPDDDDDV